MLSQNRTHDSRSVNTVNCDRHSVQGLLFIAPKTGPELLANTVNVDSRRAKNSWVLFLLG
jgi:hypothetical protein